jgi:asparagine synthase (glutamine-hydrolysing)
MPYWFNSSFAKRLDLETRWHQVNAANAAQDRRRGMTESPFWSNVISLGNAGSALLNYRYPFFDVRLLSFTLAVPPVPWFIQKTLLREAMRGALPEIVRRRPKTPFGINLSHIQAQRQPIAWMQDLAATPELEPYVKREALLAMVNEPKRTSPPEFTIMQHSLALAYWLRAQAARRHILFESKI